MQSSDPSFPFYVSNRGDFTLLSGNCIKVIATLDTRFDLVFADPPYFLSNGGISVQSGRQVCVDKGDWDKPIGRVAEREFTHAWLSIVREKMAEDASIWISGTYHNSFILAEALENLGFKLLNAVTWVKTNPPPNLSCRCLTHSSEIVLWARKSRKVPHCFNYQLMHEIAGGKQMTDVWHLPAIAPWEKRLGKHPTQKPLSLLVRLILAASKPNAMILDPFCGSGTTGIAANLLGRRFYGIDTNPEYLNIARQRREEIKEPKTARLLRGKIAGFSSSHQLEDLIFREEELLSRRIKN